MKKLALGVGVVLALAVSLGALRADATTSRKVVPVTLNEFNILPASQGAPVGKVTFTVKNGGTIEHEFVVVKTPRAAGGLLKNGEANETGAVGEIGSVKPGEKKKLVLKLKAGHYALLCNIAGHYKGGQFADFYVR